MVWLITGQGEMVKTEDGLILDFDNLPKTKQSNIEKIIERKIKEQQEKELKRLLKEVTQELERSIKN